MITRYILIIHLHRLHYQALFVHQNVLKHVAAVLLVSFSGSEPDAKRAMED